jgi:hypothetical protein
MGSEAFAPIAAGMGQRLRERYSGGALKIDMPAWLGLGHKPA